jgi:hypothetical protein
VFAVASSAYKEQFLGILFGYAAPTVWTTGRHQSASLSFFFLVWLIMQNRVQMADHLHKYGWANYGICPLYKRVPKTAAHMVFQCRFTIHMMKFMQVYMGLW